MIQQSTGTSSGRTRKLKSILGELPISEKQASRLKLDSHQRISPYLTECCLRASANVSYENAAKDVKRYTGMEVSATSQRRLVHPHQFPEISCTEKVSEISVDGGNEILVKWVNHQPLEKLLNCIGDGHSGIGNLMQQFNPEGKTREILDWFHLVENLYKVGGSNRRIHEGKKLLWQGKVDETIALFSPLKKKQAQNFCQYLENHRHRIINYDYYQTEKICAIASGAVESTVKQIDRRLKISGAQWKAENVSQVLQHRCAYLNDSLFA